MGWRDHLLRLMARGMLERGGRGLDAEAVIQTIQRIAEDPSLSERLDRLSEDEVREEFLELYAQAGRE